MDERRERELRSLRERMGEIVTASAYDLREKRLRALVLLERLVMAMTPSLSPEQQELVQQIMMLYWEVW